MMSATGGSAHSKYAGLLPIPVRLTALENDRFPNEQPSLRKRATTRWLFVRDSLFLAEAWFSGGAAISESIAGDGRVADAGLKHRRKRGILCRARRQAVTV
jgi:hypothetical protein